MGGIVVADNEVLVGIFDDEGRQRLMRSTFNHDGGKFWKQPLFDKQPSFEDIYIENQSADINSIEKIALKKHRALAKDIAKSNKNGKTVGCATNWTRYAAAAGLAIAGVGGTAYYMRTRKTN